MKQFNEFLLFSGLKSSNLFKEKCTEPSQYLGQSIFNFTNPSACTSYPLNACQLNTTTITTSTTKRNTTRTATSTTTLTTTTASVKIVTSNTSKTPIKTSSKRKLLKSQGE